MTQDGASEMPAPGVGHWEGERLEVGRRYMYRPEFIPLLTEYLGARPGTRILDVGCGSGFLTRLLARTLEGVQIVGLDADEELVAQARRELQREGLNDRVEVMCGDAYRLPFAALLAQGTDGPGSRGAAPRASGADPGNVKLWRYRHGPGDAPGHSR